MKRFLLLLIVLLALAPALATAATVTCPPAHPTACPSGQTCTQCALGVFNNVGTDASGNPYPVFAVEPHLCAQVTTSPTAGGGNQLLTGGGGGVAELGVEVINGVFAAVNYVFAQAGLQLYTNIIQNSSYPTLLNALFTLYIAVYGCMIIFNIVSHRPGEIISRLTKIAIIYMLMQGWSGTSMYGQYIAYPILDSMNDIISMFMCGSTTCGGGSVGPTTGLDPLPLATLAAPMDLIFSRTFAIVLLTDIFLGPFGWFYVLLLIWCAVRVTLMLIGAIITYIKSVVGLMFLLALGPIFFCFILFEKTKRIFVGWMNQIFGFFLQPVLLFAFLSFYMKLVNDMLLFVMFPIDGAGNMQVDYCWVQWFPFAIFDIWWWRPVTAHLATTQYPGNYPSGDWVGSVLGLPPGTSPMSFMNIMFLLFVLHIGKVVTHFLEHVSHDLTSGAGPGIVRGTDVGRWLSNNIPGMKGRRVGELAADLGGAAFYKARNWRDNRTMKRAGIGEGAAGGPGSATTYSSTTGGGPGISVVDPGAVATNTVGAHSSSSIYVPGTAAAGAANAAHNNIYGGWEPTADSATGTTAAIPPERTEPGYVSATDEINKEVAQALNSEDIELAEKALDDIANKAEVSPDDIAELVKEMQFAKDPQEYAEARSRLTEIANKAGVSITALVQLARKTGRAN